VKEIMERKEGKRPITLEEARAVTKRRRHADNFYKQELLPRVEAGEELDEQGLRDLMSEYQAAHEGANFSNLELQTFVHLGYALARERERDPLLTSRDPEGFAVKRKTLELVEKAFFPEEEGGN